MDLLTLPDLIRINKLVRGGVRIDEFEAWYAELPASRRKALTYELVQYAFQAGADDSVIRQAALMSGLPVESPAVAMLHMGSKGWRTSFPLHRWIEDSEPTSLHPVFRFAVLLFGIAEGRAYEADKGKPCNHWWHRDLMDPAVEADLLNDPDYELTSNKRDRRSKS